MPSFFTLKFAAWGMGGLFLALLLVLGVEEIRLHDAAKNAETLQANLASCTTNLATSQGNEAVLKSTLDAQNAQIRAMRAEAARRATLAAAAAKAALERAEKAKEDASRLGSGPAVMNAWQRSLYQ